MTIQKCIRWLTLSLLGLFLIAATTELMAITELRSESAEVKSAREIARREHAIDPLSPPANESAPLVALGKDLFSEPRLSSNNTVACANCHRLEQYGVDNMQLSVGVEGKFGTINAPSVYNAALNYVQFWDGRESDLEDQLDFPVTNPLEMNSSWGEVEKKLQADPKMAARFRQIFGTEPSERGVKQAIAAFERTLITVDSPFDLYLNGDEDAISAQAKTGYRLFQEYGCISCHQGRNIGGNMYEKMGIMADYFADRGHIKEADYGRFNITGIEEHRFEFRVPSLRNVAETHPYFHDGAAKTLEEAVRTMGKYQLGRNIPDSDIADIVAFLTTLTGKLPDLATK